MPFFNGVLFHRKAGPGEISLQNSDEFSTFSNIGRPVVVGRPGTAANVSQGPEGRYTADEHEWSWDRCEKGLDKVSGHDFRTDLKKFSRKRQGNLVRAVQRIGLCARDLLRACNNCEEIARVCDGLLSLDEDGDDMHDAAADAIQKRFIHRHGSLLMGLEQLEALQVAPEDMYEEWPQKIQVTGAGDATGLYFMRYEVEHSKPVYRKQTSDWVICWVDPEKYRTGNALTTAHVVNLQFPGAVEPDSPILACDAFDPLNNAAATKKRKKKKKDSEDDNLEEEDSESDEDFEQISGWLLLPPDGFAAQARSVEATSHPALAEWEERIVVEGRSNSKVKSSWVSAPHLVLHPIGDAPDVVYMYDSQEDGNIRVGVTGEYHILKEEGDERAAYQKSDKSWTLRWITSQERWISANVGAVEADWKHLDSGAIGIPADIPDPSEMKDGWCRWEASSHTWTNSPGVICNPGELPPLFVYVQSSQQNSDYVGVYKLQAELQDGRPSYKSERDMIIRWVSDTTEWLLCHKDAVQTAEENEDETTEKQDDQGEETKDEKKGGVVCSMDVDNPAQVGSRWKLKHGTASAGVDCEEVKEAPSQVFINGGVEFKDSRGVYSRRGFYACRPWYQKGEWQLRWDRRKLRWNLDLEKSTMVSNKADCPDPARCYLEWGYMLGTHQTFCYGFECQLADPPRRLFVSGGRRAHRGHKLYGMYFLVGERDDRGVWRQEEPGKGWIWWDVDNWKWCLGVQTNGAEEALASLKDDIPHPAVETTESWELYGHFAPPALQCEEITASPPQLFLHDALDPAVDGVYLLQSQEWAGRPAYRKIGAKSAIRWQPSLMSWILDGEGLRDSEEGHLFLGANVPDPSVDWTGSTIGSVLWKGFVDEDTAKAAEREAHLAGLLDLSKEGLMAKEESRQSIQGNVGTEAAVQGMMSRLQALMADEDDVMVPKRWARCKARCERVRDPPEMIFFNGREGDLNDINGVYFLDPNPTDAEKDDSEGFQRPVYRTERVGLATPWTIRWHTVVRKWVIERIPQLAGKRRSALAEGLAKDATLSAAFGQIDYDAPHPAAAKGEWLIKVNGEWETDEKVRCELVGDPPPEIFILGPERRHQRVNGTYLLLDTLLERRPVWKKEHLSIFIRWYPPERRWIVDGSMKSTPNGLFSVTCDAPDPTQVYVPWARWDMGNFAWEEDRHMACHPGRAPPQRVFVAGSRRPSLNGLYYFNCKTFHDGRPAYTRENAEWAIRWHDFSKTWVIDEHGLRDTQFGWCFIEEDVPHPAATEGSWIKTEKTRGQVTIEDVQCFQVGKPPLAVVVTGHSGRTPGMAGLYTTTVEDLEEARPLYRKQKPGSPWVIRWYGPTLQWIIDDKGLRDSRLGIASIKCDAPNPVVANLGGTEWLVRTGTADQWFRDDFVTVSEMKDPPSHVYLRGTACAKDKDDEDSEFADADGLYSLYHEDWNQRPQYAKVTDESWRIQWDVNDAGWTVVQRVGTIAVRVCINYSDCMAPSAVNQIWYLAPKKKKPVTGTKAKQRMSAVMNAVKVGMALTASKARGSLPDITKKSRGSLTGTPQAGAMSEKLASKAGRNRNSLPEESKIDNENKVAPEIFCGDLVEPPNKIFLDLPEEGKGIYQYERHVEGRPAYVQMKKHTSALRWHAASRRWIFGKFWKQKQVVYDGDGAPSVELKMAKDGDEYIAQDVREHSTAEAAGILRGSRLIAINGDNETFRKNLPERIFWGLESPLELMFDVPEFDRGPKGIFSAHCDAAHPAAIWTRWDKPMTAEEIEIRKRNSIALAYKKQAGLEDDEEVDEMIVSHHLQQSQEDSGEQNEGTEVEEEFQWGEMPPDWNVVCRAVENPPQFIRVKSHEGVPANINNTYKLVPELHKGRPVYVTDAGGEFGGAPWAIRWYPPNKRWIIDSHGIRNLELADAIANVDAPHPGRVVDCGGMWIIEQNKLARTMRLVPGKPISDEDFASIVQTSLSSLIGQATIRSEDTEKMEALAEDLHSATIDAEVLDSFCSGIVGEATAARRKIYGWLLLDDLRFLGAAQAQKYTIKDLKKRVIVNEANVTVADEGSLRTALHIVALHGPFEKWTQEACGLIIEAKASLDVQDEQGLSPLLLSAAHKKYGNMKALLSFTCSNVERLPTQDENHGSDAGSMLVEAAQHNVHEVKRLLMDISFPNFQDGEGKTAAHYLAMKNQVQLLELIGKQKGDFNLQDNKGYTPMHYAVESNLDHCIRVLVKLKAHPGIRHKEGMTPLMVALSQRQPAAMKELQRGILQWSEIEDIIGKNCIGDGCYDWKELTCYKVQKLVEVGFGRNDADIMVTENLWSSTDRLQILNQVVTLDPNSIDGIVGLEPRGRLLCRELVLPLLKMAGECNLNSHSDGVKYGQFLTYLLHSGVSVFMGVEVIYEVQEGLHMLEEQYKEIIKQVRPKLGHLASEFGDQVGMGRQWPAVHQSYAHGPIDWLDPGVATYNSIGVISALIDLGAFNSIEEACEFVKKGSQKPADVPKILWEKAYARWLSARAQVANEVMQNQIEKMYHERHKAVKPKPWEKIMERKEEFRQVTARQFKMNDPARVKELKEKIKRENISRNSAKGGMAGAVGKVMKMGNVTKAFQQVGEPEKEEAEAEEGALAGAVGKVMKMGKVTKAFQPSNEAAEAEQENEADEAEAEDPDKSKAEPTSPKENRNQPHPLEAGGQTDLVRCSIVCADANELKSTFSELMQTRFDGSEERGQGDSGVEVICVWNNFAREGDDKEYKDMRLCVVVRSPNDKHHDFLGEIQLVLHPMLQVRKHYKILDAYEKGKFVEQNSFVRGLCAQRVAGGARKSFQTEVEVDASNTSTTNMAREDMIVRFEVHEAEYPQIWRWMPRKMVELSRLLRPPNAVSIDGWIEVEVAADELEALLQNHNCEPPPKQVDELRRGLESGVCKVFSDPKSRLCRVEDVVVVVLGAPKCKFFLESDDYILVREANPWIKQPGPAVVSGPRHFSETWEQATRAALVRDMPGPIREAITRVPKVDQIPKSHDAWFIESAQKKKEKKAQSYQESETSTPTGSQPASLMGSRQPSTASLQPTGPGQRGPLGVGGKKEGLRMMRRYRIVKAEFAPGNDPFLLLAAAVGTGVPQDDDDD